MRWIGKSLFLLPSRPLPSSRDMSHSVCVYIRVRLIMTSCRLPMFIYVRGCKLLPSSNLKGYPERYLFIQRVRYGFGDSYVTFFCLALICYLQKSICDFLLFSSVSSSLFYTHNRSTTHALFSFCFALFSAKQSIIFLLPLTLSKLKCSLTKYESPN